MAVFNQHVVSTPTLVTSEYNVGNSLGGKLNVTVNSIASNIPLYFESAMLYDSDNHATNIEVILFDEDPTSSTIIDNTDFVLDSNDYNKLVCNFNFDSNSYITHGNLGVYGHMRKILLNGLSGGDTLYLVLVENSKVVNSDVSNISRSTDGLTLKFNITG